MNERRSENVAFIAVHAGAGYHSTGREAEYRSVCARACKQATELLKSGVPALDVVTMVIQCLEDSELTNAGRGSNFTISGTVECDASIMDGQTLHFGAVGALSDIRNPIQVAKKLVDVQKDGTMSAGRVPPCILVGPGASSWARQNGIDTVSSQTLESERARRTFESHKRRLEAAEERRQHKRRKHQAVAETPPADCIQDTVGAVCVDSRGDIAAGSSSGGVSLKQPGRLGPAAMYGAGCWAYNWRSADKPGVAVATSGTGEHLMKTMLAKTCADHMQREDLPSQALQVVFKDNFLESEYIQDTEQKFGGVLALRLDKAEIQSGEPAWAILQDDGLPAIQRPAGPGHSEVHTNSYASKRPPASFHEDTELPPLAASYDGPDELGSYLPAWLTADTPSHPHSPSRASASSSSSSCSSSSSSSSSSLSGSSSSSSCSSSSDSSRSSTPSPTPPTGRIVIQLSRRSVRPKSPQLLPCPMRPKSPQQARSPVRPKSPEAPAPMRSPILPPGSMSPSPSYVPSFEPKPPMRFLSTSQPNNQAFSASQQYVPSIEPKSQAAPPIVLPKQQMPPRSACVPMVKQTTPPCAPRGDISIDELISSLSANTLQPHVQCPANTLQPHVQCPANTIQPHVQCRANTLQPHVQCPANAKQLTHSQCPRNTRQIQNVNVVDDDVYMSPAAAKCSSISVTHPPRRQPSSPMEMSAPNMVSLRHIKADTYCPNEVGPKPKMVSLRHIKENTYCPVEIGQQSKLVSLRHLKAEINCPKEVGQCIAPMDIEKAAVNCDVVVKRPLPTNAFPFTRNSSAAADIQEPMDVDAHVIPSSYSAVVRRQNNRDHLEKSLKLARRPKRKYFADELDIQADLQEYPAKRCRLETLQQKYCADDLIVQKDIQVYPAIHHRVTAPSAVSTSAGSPIVPSPLPKLPAMAPFSTVQPLSRLMQKHRMGRAH